MSRPIGLRSARQRAQETILAHVVLERLAAIYEDDGYLVVVLLPQLSVTVDVDLTPLEVGLLLGILESLFDDVAEMTSTA